MQMNKQDQKPELQCEIFFIFLKLFIWCTVCVFRECLSIYVCFSFPVDLEDGMCNQFLIIAYVFLPCYSSAVDISVIVQILNGFTLTDR